jgi:hypothetical protein
MQALLQKHTKSSYNQRKAHESPLYQILHDYYEIYVNEYEDKSQKTYEGFRNCIEKAVAEFLDCGIYEGGFASLRCPECKTEILIPFHAKVKYVHHAIRREEYSGLKKLQTM